MGESHTKSFAVFSFAESNGIMTETLAAWSRGTPERKMKARQAHAVMRLRSPYAPILLASSSRTLRFVLLIDDEMEAYFGRIALMAMPFRDSSTNPPPPLPLSTFCPNALTLSGENFSNSHFLRILSPSGTISFAILKRLSSRRVTKSLGRRSKHLLSLRVKVAVRPCMKTA